MRWQEGVESRVVACIAVTSNHLYLPTISRAFHIACSFTRPPIYAASPDISRINNFPTIIHIAGAAKTFRRGLGCRFPRSGDWGSSPLHSLQRSRVS